MHWNNRVNTHIQTRVHEYSLLRQRRPPTANTVKAILSITAALAGAVVERGGSCCRAENRDIYLCNYTQTYFAHARTQTLTRRAYAHIHTHIRSHTHAHILSVSARAHVMDF